MQRSETIRRAAPVLPALMLAPGLAPVIPRGSAPEDVAGIIAAHLIRGTVPATRIFTWLTGREITLDVIGPHTRPGQGDEIAYLRLHDGDQLYVREGHLMAGSIQCAKVSLKLVPARLPGVTWGQIRSGIPAGTVLGPHGLTRERRRIEVVPGGNPAVTSWGVLYLGAAPVGIATEDIPEDLCMRLAVNAA